MAIAAVEAREAPLEGGPEELVDAVHDVMKSILHRLHPTLEDAGISMGQFWALHLVSSLRRTTLSTVAKHLALSAPTVCANVDQLVRQGLVQRQRSDEDRRRIELTLTARGRRVEETVWKEVAGVMAAATTEVPRRDLAAATRVFHTVRRRLDGPEPLVRRSR